MNMHRVVVQEEPERATPARQAFAEPMRSGFAEVPGMAFRAPCVEREGSPDGQLDLMLHKAAVACELRELCQHGGTGVMVADQQVDGHG